jgi:uncharacterized RDD family membrane protein YckC
MENVIPEVTSSVEFPSLSDRFQSTFIDSLFIVTMMFICSSVLERYENVPDWVRIVLFFGLWGIYEPVCTSVGATIGNFAKNIRVRRVSGINRKINILQAFFRYVLKISLGWLSFVSIHFNPEKRAIHDLAVGSVMIKNKPLFP